ncbi:MAG: 3'-5' exonuclease [Acetobacteraceae bacterium]
MPDLFGDFNGLPDLEARTEFYQHDQNWSNSTILGDSKLTNGTMHLAKRLEFRGGVVMACDEDVLPLEQRIEDVTDKSDLEDVYNTERHLLYVVCTRARDRLLVTGIRPGSDFLADLKAPPSDRISGPG